MTERIAHPIIARLCDGSIKAYAPAWIPDGSVTILWQGEPCEAAEARRQAIARLDGAWVCSTCENGYVNRAGHELGDGRWACCIECREEDFK